MLDNIELQSETKSEPATADGNDLGAWLLPIGHGASVAVGRHELKYIEYISAGVTLPGLPAYCEQGFQWRERFIPALDLHSLVERRRIPMPEGERMAAIIAYENAQGTIDLGAIFLQGVPKLLSVLPQQSVPVAELKTAWRLVSHAAFVSQDTIYPVLDLRCLFDKTPADLLVLH
jgi:chemotaxis signal transduction protein